MKTRKNLWVFGLVFVLFVMLGGVAILAGHAPIAVAKVLGVLGLAPIIGMAINEGPATFTANGALGANLRVKMTAASTTTPPQVELAGLGEQHIGVTEYAVADGDLVSVKLRTASGTIEFIAAKAIAIATTVYGAAAGKISDASSGSAIGITKKAASGDGSIVEVIPFNVQSTTAATVSIADAGNFTAQTTVEAALQEIYQDLLSAQSTIPVPLTAITREDGTPLIKQATTVAGFAQLADKETVIDIPVDCSAGEALGFSIPVPQNLDDAQDISVHVLAGKTSALDALTLDCEVYPVAVGGGAAADIQDTAAQAITEAISELVFVCGADGVLAAPGSLSVVLALGGTNDGDAVNIYGVWIEYQKKVMTS